MSEENVETFRRGFAAVNRRDLDGFLATVAPDVEFMSLIAEAEGETFRGHEGVRRWWKEVCFHSAACTASPEEFATSVTPWSHGRRDLSPSGVEVRQTFGARPATATGWRRGGQLFRTEAEALEAAGLEE